MRLSDRVRSEVKADRVPVSWKDGTLSSSQLSELDTLYDQMLPEYSHIVSEYEHEKNRAKNKRSLSNFPSREKWKPPARILSDRECELIAGPKNHVEFIKKLSLRDTHTGRCIYYTASECERRPSRTSSSYVALHVCTSESDTPVFAQIQSLFTHSFASHTYDWAILDVFDTPLRDSESSMWNVHHVVKDQRCALVLNLSYPLVVAPETSSSRLWFLNLVSV